MEKLVASALEGVIGAYVQNLDADAVTDSLWAKGALSLHSLQLNTEVDGRICVAMATELDLTRCNDHF